MCRKTDTITFEMKDPIQLLSTEEILTFVANTGAVSVAIDASQKLQHYKQGESINNMSCFEYLSSNRSNDQLKDRFFLVKRPSCQRGHQIISYLKMLNILGLH